ncbi:hypothetical protein BDV96DRAFT_350945 [Lophiotrema nucula]|uniref:Uncharacterized protein n=1 Tax=Lophiotrema nucula TaxID=690887 RepID=A0A6A5ZK70_9PLEO|nr:hypothetical protein BDV96DRAFT_350945 [Lophiotrema nucula]
MALYNVEEDLISFVSEEGQTIAAPIPQSPYTSTLLNMNGETAGSLALPTPAGPNFPSKGVADNKGLTSLAVSNSRPAPKNVDSFASLLSQSRSAIASKPWVSKPATPMLEHSANSRRRNTQQVNGVSKKDYFPSSLNASGLRTVSSGPALLSNASRIVPGSPAQHTQLQASRPYPSINLNLDKNAPCLVNGVSQGAGPRFPVSEDLAELTQSATPFDAPISVSKLSNLATNEGDDYTQLEQQLDWLETDGGQNISTPGKEGKDAVTASKPKRIQDIQLGADVGTSSSAKLGRTSSPNQQVFVVPSPRANLDSGTRPVVDDSEWHACFHIPVSGVKGPPPGLNTPQGTFNLDTELQQTTAEDDNQPVVRLNLDVYNVLLQNNTKLKEKVKAAEETLQRELQARQLASRIDVDEKDNEIARLQTQLKFAEKESRRTQSLQGERDNIQHILTTKEAELRTMTNILTEKEKQLFSLRTAVDSQGGQFNEQNKRLQDDLDRTEQELVAMKSSCAKKEQLIKELGEERDKLINKPKDGAERTQEAILAQKAARIDSLHEEINKEKSKNEFLSARIIKLQANTQSQDVVKKLEEEKKMKSAEVSRLRQELMKKEKELEGSRATALRITDGGKSYRFAATLVVPSVKAKLPKTVFSCLHCYSKNLQCDNHARCQNCNDAGENCQRWRCTAHHLLKQCATVPCDLTHTPDGWLMTREERPQW